MSATTVNAFPPLHAFNSSRGWFIALIVLLHAGILLGAHQRAVSPRSAEGAAEAT